MTRNPGVFRYADGQYWRLYGQNADASTDMDPAIFEVETLEVDGATGIARWKRWTSSLVQDACGYRY